MLHQPPSSTLFPYTTLFRSLPITIIASIFLLYAYFGPYLPGEFGHRGLSLNQLMKTMYFSTEGILGTPISVSATYIFLFLLFGSFLVQTGVGKIGRASCRE